MTDMTINGARRFIREATSRPEAHRIKLGMTPDEHRFRLASVRLLLERRTGRTGWDAWCVGGGM